MELLLDPEEIELVYQFLVERHHELLREISRTHHHQFKETHRHKEKILAAVLDRLAAMRFKSEALI